MRITLLLILCLFSAQILAQRGGTENNRALKFYQEAQQHKRFNRYEQAELYYQKALERDPQYLDAKFDLGETYMRMGQIDKSVELMEDIVKQDPRFVPTLIINLAQIAQEREQYDKALSYFEQYMGIAPPESNNYMQAKRGAASCEFAMWALENPVDFNPENMGENVNSEYDEYFPAMTADEQLLIFTREIPAPNNPYSNDGSDEEFFFCEKDDNDEWKKAYNPGPPINSPWREGAPTISPDGKYVIFTVCELFGSYGPDKNGFGSCDLFVSARDGNEWSKPVNMGRTINSRNWETQPCFASDGLTLFFIRVTYDRDRVKS
ncbi:MAG: tetratricopeptide repeat protein, partial [Salibacteraceae bacterium]